MAACRKRQMPVPAIRWVGEQPRLPAEREKLGKALLEIARTGDGGKPKSGRRYFYLALSHGYIKPDMSATDAGKKSRDAAYDTVNEVLCALRKQGRLSWGMVLDLTRDIVKWRIYDSPRQARAELRRDYDEDRWRGQDFYPVFVFEKDTMEPVCEPMAADWQMPFVSSRGYGSLKIEHEVADLLNTRQFRTGQELIILFLSDLDPSGIDLQRAWEKALADFGVKCPFIRVALTMEQVERPDLDIKRLSIEVKEGDSRSAKFIQQYGTRCWESDVLPAEIIRQEIDSIIGQRLNWKLWRRRNAEIERARKRL